MRTLIALELPPRFCPHPASTTVTQTLPFRSLKDVKRQYYIALSSAVSHLTPRYAVVVMYVARSLSGAIFFLNRHACVWGACCFAWARGLV